MPTLPVDMLSVDLTGSGETALSAFLHHTFLANIAGIPALTVPCGFSTSRCRSGSSSTAVPFGEPTIFRIGHAYESATDWHLRRPEVGRVAA